MWLFPEHPSESWSTPLSLLQLDESKAHLNECIFLFQYFTSINLNLYLVNIITHGALFGEFEAAEEILVKHEISDSPLFEKGAPFFCQKWAPQQFAAEGIGLWIRNHEVRLKVVVPYSEILSDGCRHGFP